MWKKYSLEFIRKNRASSLSIMTASLIASLFLSLLCSLFFNVWVYEVGTITMEEGGWQGRISGSLDRDAVSVIEAFANVDHVEINEALSGSQGQVAEVFFQNKRTIYQDMPQIAEKLGLGETAVSYHERLLSRYLIYDPQDSSPPLLPAFYLGILVLVCLSLVFIIHNSFAVSMNARIHQFGILSSIGAAPGQILACLLEEAAMLCAAPILLGCLAGTGLSFGTIKLLNALASGIPGRHPAVFSCHPLVFAITMASAVLTVFFSAWLPAWKLSRMTPLAAVHSSGEFRLTRKKHSPVLKALFGVEGQLAGNALKAQRHALRTSTLSLTFSFLGFTLMMCFFTLSDISTSHTYFQRYQDAWDVMVTVKGEEAAGDKLENEAEWEALHSLANARDCVIYQKAEAVCLVPEEAISEEITETGGLEMVLGKTDLEKIVMEDDGYYPVKAPVIILDDTSFQNYCRQLGIAPDGRGSIVRNCVWDRVNSNFRYKEFVPLLKTGQTAIRLQNWEPNPEPNQQPGRESNQQPNLASVQQSVEIPVLACTENMPLLREEYAADGLVQFLPASLWKQIAGTVGPAEPDVYIRALVEEGAGLMELEELETELTAILGGDYDFEIENRIQEKLDNDRMLAGYRLIIGAFCILLAAIGIANVFSNTMGFLQQRKREFARYMSVGMTPGGMKKMFFIEALVIAGRPVLITLPVTVLLAGLMIKVSYLNPAEFLAQAPVLPIAFFALAVFGFVALAYVIGGRRILACSLTEALRDDTMM